MEASPDSQGYTKKTVLKPLSNLQQTETAEKSRARKANSGVAGAEVTDSH